METFLEELIMMNIKMLFKNSANANMNPEENTLLLNMTMIQMLKLLKINYQVNYLEDSQLQLNGAKKVESIYYFFINFSSYKSQKI